MDPESLTQKEIMDSWMEVLENGNPETAAIAKSLFGHLPGFAGYNLDDLDLYEDEESEDEPDGPEDKFVDYPEVVCLNAVGIEDGFDEGVTYVAQYLDDEFFVVYDRNGQKREVLAERFKEVESV